MLDQGFDAAEQFHLQNLDRNRVGKAEPVNGKLLHVEGGGTVPPKEDLAQEQKESSTCRVQLAIGGQIKMEVSADRFHLLEEEWIPDEAPCSCRLWVQGETVTEEAQAHFSMFTTHYIPEVVVLIGDRRQPSDGVCKVLILTTTSAGMCVDHSELLEAVVRGGMELDLRLLLAEGQCQEPPEVELVMRRETGRTIHFGLRDPGVTLSVGETILALVNLILLQGLSCVERTQGMLDERELPEAGVA